MLGHIIPKNQQSKFKKSRFSEAKNQGKQEWRQNFTAESNQARSMAWGS
jgi:hypothetical protein